MRVGLGIDQLGGDADLSAGPPYAPLEHITHSQLAADLLRVSRSVPISERSIAGDHGHVCKPRQIGCQVLGDAVCKILLFAVVAQIDEGQDHDRQSWRNGRSGIRNLLLHWSLVAHTAGAHLGSELISSTSDRADKAAVLEGYAKRPNLGAQIALFDDAARPNAADQLVFVNDGPISLDQR